jgi:hypothetical protein
MLNVFRKEYAMNHPLAIITPWDGPVTFVTDRQVPLTQTVNPDTLLAVNLRGAVTTIVTGYLSRMSASRSQLAMPSPSAVKSTLDLALSQVSPKLAPAIRQLNEYEDPTNAEWPPDSKAFLRWSALGSMASRNAPLLAFKPLWEVLSRHTQYNSDPQRPKITRISSPGTHKTGSIVVSSILYRFASRHHLRIFHRGEWPFLETDVIKSPAKEWQNKYDVVFSQLCAKGQWHGGDYDDASALYKHLLGPEHHSVMVTSEPSQHYIDWLYFYVIPKKRNFKPIEVLGSFIKARMNRNMYMQEFAVRTFEQYDKFMANHVPKFDLVLVRERMDECLVLLRRMYNWDIRDITYLRPLAGSTRFDGKPLTRTPRLSELDDKMQKSIKDLVKLDYKFYEAANQRLDELIAEQGADFKAEVCTHGNFCCYAHLMPCVHT